MRETLQRSRLNYLNYCKTNSLQLSVLEYFAKKNSSSTNQSKNVTNLKVLQTFLPPGSRAWVEDKQQSRALRALRKFISTQSPVLQTGPQEFFCCIILIFLILCPTSTLPSSLSLSGESSCSSGAAREVKAPQLPSSHFLGKSEPLPSIHSDTGLLLKMTTHTHTHWWSTYKAWHTRLLFTFCPRTYCWGSYKRWWRKPSSFLTSAHFQLL